MTDPREMTLEEQENMTEEEKAAIYDMYETVREAERRKYEKQYEAYLAQHPEEARQPWKPKPHGGRRDVWEKEYGTNYETMKDIRELAGVTDTTSKRQAANLFYRLYAAMEIVKYYGDDTRWQRVMERGTIMTELGRVLKQDGLDAGLFDIILGDIPGRIARGESTTETIHFIRSWRTVIRKKGAVNSENEEREEAEELWTENSLNNTLGTM